MDVRGVGWHPQIWHHTVLERYVAQVRERVGGDGEEGMGLTPGPFSGGSGPTPDFLKPLEPANPKVSPSWGLEIPSGDHAGSVH